MKNLKNFLALTLALIIAFSLSVTVFAESEKSNTEVLLDQISETGKINASVTSFTYGSNITNDIKFNLYDDLNNNKILCDFTEKNISVIYDTSSIKVVFKKFFSYLTFDLTDSQFLLATGAITLFQKTFKSFADDPKLSAFDLTVTSTEKDGQIYTVECFKGKAIGTSGTFCYDQNGSLCEITLTDNAGASISFTISSFSNNFDNSVFNLPIYYFNISFFWKILSIVLPMLGISIPFMTA